MSNNPSNNNEETGMDQDLDYVFQNINKEMNIETKKSTNNSTIIEESTEDDESIYNQLDKENETNDFNQNINKSESLNRFANPFAIKDIISLGRDEMSKKNFGEITCVSRWF